VCVCVCVCVLSLGWYHMRHLRLISILNHQLILRDIERRTGLQSVEQGREKQREKKCVQLCVNQSLI